MSLIETCRANQANPFVLPAGGRAQRPRRQGQPGPLAALELPGQSRPHLGDRVRHRQELIDCPNPIAIRWLFHASARLPKGYDKTNLLIVLEPGPHPKSDYSNREKWARAKYQPISGAEDAPAAGNKGK